MQKWVSWVNPAKFLLALRNVPDLDAAKKFKLQIFNYQVAIFRYFPESPLQDETFVLFY